MSFNLHSRRCTDFKCMVNVQGLCGQMFSNPLDKLGVELLSCRVAVCLIFKNLWSLVESCTILQTSNVWECCCVTHCHRFGLSTHFHTSHSGVHWWQLLVMLICISLTARVNLCLLVSDRVFLFVFHLGHLSPYCRAMKDFNIFCVQSFVRYQHCKYLLCLELAYLHSHDLWEVLILMKSNVLFFLLYLMLSVSFLKTTFLFQVCKDVILCFCLV